MASRDGSKVTIDYDCTCFLYVPPMKALIILATKSPEPIIGITETAKYVIAVYEPN